ncbi:MAG: 2-dehydro-3-deoxygalactonokinase [Geminicoccaceae bacterium]|nr:2-dehydro-3-deoxygalactonokinase [Geminicoccaceae bacterium]
MGDGALVAVDWGTTSFRAAVMDRHGEVIRSVDAKAGIMQVHDGAFEEVLARELSRLEAPRGVPVMASGMITSRQGWVEVPYAPCPAGGAEIAAGVVTRTIASGHDVHFISGLIDMSDPARPDVMRGEETQIVGAMPVAADAAMAVLPGTHSKWALVADGRIERFSTFMTGEVFAVLGEHSILGRLMEAGPDDEAGFDKGVEAGVAEGSALLHDLFSARTLPLTGGLAGKAVASYLSGLLIGSEIGGARAIFGSPATRRACLIGSSGLVARYRRALGIAGIDCSVAAPDAAARGMVEIARARGLLPTVSENRT